MKYFFDILEMPIPYRNQIVQERSNVDRLIKEGRKNVLSKLEDKYFKEWGYWKEQVDFYSNSRRPDSREKMLLARFELTKYNEILKYCGNANPNSRIKVKYEIEV